MDRTQRYVGLGLIGLLMAGVLLVMVELTKGIDIWPLVSRAVTGTSLDLLLGPATQMYWCGALVLAFISGARLLLISRPQGQQPLIYVSLRLQRVAGALVTGLGLALFFWLRTFLGIGPWLIPGCTLLGIGLPLVLVSDRRLLLGGVTSGLGLGLLGGLLTMGVGPWMIGGLGPLFVGLALVLVGLMPAERAKA